MVLNKKDMAGRIITRMADTWGCDTENLVKEPSLLEDMADQASGARDAQPRKTLRNRQYGTMPLMVRPDYKGDFLDKLRENVYKDKSADQDLQDIDSPSDWAKYIPETQPRDLQDEFYEMNKPGPGVGYQVYKEYNDRSWDKDDAPEMSEDKILRQNQWGDMRPVSQPLDVRVFHGSEDVDYNNHRARAVVATYLMRLAPKGLALEKTAGRVVTAYKYLKDLEKALITTSKGTRTPGKGLSTGALLDASRSDAKNGKWVFRTGKGHSTVFQFVPEKNITDVNRLFVRVSCSCPSWVYWGAQFNAATEGYLYTSPAFPMRVKHPETFSDPIIRDKGHQFLVCKHVIACIPTVSAYRLEGPEKPEALKIPRELVSIGNKPSVQSLVKKWQGMSQSQQLKYINSSTSAPELTYISFVFPDIRKDVALRLMKILEGYPEEKRSKAPIRNMLLKYLDYFKDIVKNLKPQKIYKEVTGPGKELLEPIQKELIKKVPSELRSVGNNPGVKKIIQDWPKMSEVAKKNVIDSGDYADLTYLSFALPEIREEVATKLVELLEELPEFDISGRSAVRRERIKKNLKYFKDVI